MSYTNLNYHVAYSTKERRPFLQADLLPQLVKYTGGVIRKLNGQMLEANGPEDHFHIMAILPPTIAVSECIQKIKAGTSGWIHKTFPQHKDFNWQDGYAAFSVSHSAVPKVVEYIQNQQEHHKKMTFEEELIALLKRHNIPYDEKYLR
ncbi:MAG: IS200/IS605 family transposase [Phycisphaerae bacterium]|nr:IS200/IS605 family transposase [Phycisphaerae bacterium]